MVSGVVGHNIMIKSTLLHWVFSSFFDHYIMFGEVLDFRLFGQRSLLVLPVRRTVAYIQSAGLDCTLYWVYLLSSIIYEYSKIKD